MLQKDGRLSTSEDCQWSRWKLFFRSKIAPAGNCQLQAKYFNAVTIRKYLFWNINSHLEASYDPSKVGGIGWVDTLLHSPDPWEVSTAISNLKYLPPILKLFAKPGQSHCSWVLSDFRCICRNCWVEPQHQSDQQRESWEFLLILLHLEVAINRATVLQGPDVQCQIPVDILILVGSITGMSSTSSI